MAHNQFHATIFEKTTTRQSQALSQTCDTLTGVIIHLESFKIDEDLATTQKNIEIAAGCVAHHTKAERTTKNRVRQRMSDYVRKLLHDARKRSRGKCSRNRIGKQGLNTCEILPGTWEEEGEKKTADRMICERELYRGWRRVAEKSVH